VSRRISGTLFSILSACGYAFLPIFAKLAYQEGLGALDILIWRFVIASALLWPIALLWQRNSLLRLLTRRDVATLLALGGVFAVVALLSFWGLERIPAAIYSPLFYTYPAMVALISMLMGERLPVSAWLAIGLATVGCTINAFAAGDRLVIANPLDIVFPLSAAGFYAIYLTQASRRTRHISGLTSGVISISSTLAVLLIVGAFVTGVKVPTTLNGWGVAVGIAIVSTVVAILAMFAGMARIGAARASILSTLEPVITVILATLLLKENLGIAQLGGGALIVLSALLLNMPVGQPDLTAKAEPDAPFAGT
jgi:drug/metabolite transporter (DMT)-like permease